jgi:hypothetical protein
MRILLMFATLLYAVVLLHGSIAASVHSMEMHDHSAPDDMQMHKLHAMKPMFSVESANLETALKKGESGTDRG